jgi:outer membrane lipoprotein SlyB
MKNRRFLLIPACAVALALGGCTFPSSSKTLPPSQVGQLQKRSVATVTKVSPVVIDGQKTSMGQYGGAVIGGAAAVPGGGGISGRGDALAVAGASLLGAVVGQAVEEFATRQKAQEITLQMPDGTVYVIVHPTPPEFQVGDKVHVISGSNGARLEMALEF